MPADLPNTGSAWDDGLGHVLHVEAVGPLTVACRIWAKDDPADAWTYPFEHDEWRTLPKTLLVP